MCSIPVTGMDCFPLFWLRVFQNLTRKVKETDSCLSFFFPFSLFAFVLNSFFMKSLLLFVIIQLLNCNIMGNKNYYCEYCGHKFPDVRQLTSGTCSKHPAGSNKGRHKLYEGSEKSEYTCKYCGKRFPSIMVMVGCTCVNHPDGSNKGNHSPAL